MAYNTSVQKSSGYEPFFLMHGFHAATAMEVVLPTPGAIAGDDQVADGREKVLRKLEESQARQKKAYELMKLMKLMSKDVTYKVGDFILVEDLMPIPGLSSKLLCHSRGQESLASVPMG